MNENEKEPNGYRIRCGKLYPVYRSEYGGNVFFKIPAGKIKLNGEDIPAYKNVSFYDETQKKLVKDIQDGTIIKPLALFESGYFPKNDRYNVVWTVTITKWEVHLNEKQERENAINEYKNSIEMKDLEFGDGDLPF